MLWSLNLSGEGVLAPTLFGHCKCEVKKLSKFFPLQSTLDSEFFGLAKFEVKNFSEIFPLPSALDFKFLGGGGLCTNFFWSLQILGQNFLEFFPLQFTLVSEFFLDLGDGGLSTNFFLVTPNLRSKIFQNFFLYLALWSLNFSWFQGKGWSRHQLFLVMPNLQSKIFQKFFLYQVLWSLNFSSFGVCPGTNFVWSLQIWGQKFFRIFSFTWLSGLWILLVSGKGWSQH